MFLTNDGVRTGGAEEPACWSEQAVLKSLPPLVCTTAWNDMAGVDKSAI